MLVQELRQFDHSAPSTDEDAALGVLYVSAVVIETMPAHVCGTVGEYPVAQTVIQIDAVGIGLLSVLADQFVQRIATWQHQGPKNPCAGRSVALLVPAVAS